MIVQQNVFLTMIRNPVDGSWKCVGSSLTEEEANEVAKQSMENVALSYSFHSESKQRAIKEMLESVRVIPAVINYDDWDLIRV